MTRHGLLLGVAVLLAAADARAQDSPMSNEMRAEYLFQRGEKKFDSGKYAEACADFSDSLRLGPKLGTLLNLALCHETVGKLATAWKEYNHAAAWAAQNKQTDRHDFANQHVLALEPRLPRTVFQLPAGTTIATMEVDGEPLPDSQWYMPVYLDPGEHAVAITAPGKARRSVSFRVIASPTEQIVVVPSMEDEAPPVPKKPAPVPDEDATRRLGGWVALGIGAAGVLLGTAYGVMAVNARDDIGTHCSGNVCDGIGAPHYRDAQDRATISTIGFGVGIVAVAAGVYLLATSRPKPVAVGAAF